MLEIETFDPPEGFREHALLNGSGVIYEEAEADWKGWWVKQAKQLHWFKEPTQDLDDSNPPFYKWFADGKIQRLLQLPGPARGCRPWRPGGLPLAW